MHAFETYCKIINYKAQFSNMNHFTLEMSQTDLSDENANSLKFIIVSLNNVIFWKALYLPIPGVQLWCPEQLWMWLVFSVGNDESDIQHQDDNANTKSSIVKSERHFGVSLC